ncbi:MAG: TIGR02186 family protein, partial [Pseudomonadota bacterium]
MYRFAVAIVVIFGVVMAFPLAASDRLVASLDKYLVAIETDFTGESLILFGTFRTDGQVLITVHGPDETLQIYQKERSFGIWHNAQRKLFEEVPSFYFFGYTGEHVPSLDERLLRSHEIEVHNIRFLHKGAVVNGDANDDVRPYLDALIRHKTA